MSGRSHSQASKQKKGTVLVFCFCFDITLGGIRDLFLTLCSGFILGGLKGQMENQGSIKLGQLPAKLVPKLSYYLYLTISPLVLALTQWRRDGELSHQTLIKDDPSRASREGDQSESLGSKLVPLVMGGERE